MVDQTKDPNSAANAVDPNSTTTTSTSTVKTPSSNDVTGLSSNTPVTTNSALIAPPTYNSPYGYGLGYGSRFPGIMESQTPLGNGDPEKIGRARESYNTTDVNLADKNRDNLFESQQKHDTWEIGKPMLLSALAGMSILGITGALAGAALNPKYVSYQRKWFGFGPKDYKNIGYKGAFLNREVKAQTKVASRGMNATRFGIGGAVVGILGGLGIGAASSLQ